MIAMSEDEPTSTHDSSGDHKQMFMAVNANVSIISNSTGATQSKIIVRTEEVVIVTLVLVLWVAAIALFFNRWGKIRMLEPYQPKFIQQHRPSCPLVDQIQHRSFSKFNINGDSCTVHNSRPRQNSDFAGSSVLMHPLNPPRKVKSAFDLQNLILSDPALNKGVIKYNLTGDDLRRSSLRTNLNIYPASERRLSFKDLIDQEITRRVQCCVERDPTDGDPSKRSKKMGDCKQGKSISNQSSVSDSRHNSITCQDTKLNVAIRSDGRSSLLPMQLDTDSVSNFRRNSTILVNSLEADRNYLLPRSETVKSGVIDFRRNSMLIISNLNEDIGIRSFGRNMSLGGSNMNLGSEFSAVRRSSVIPPFHDHKPKVTVSVARPKPTSISPDNKLLANQKPSKSLDSSECSRVTPPWKHVKRDSSPVIDYGRQFLAPVTVQHYSGSTASLNADHHRPDDQKPIDDSRNLSATELVGPRIVYPESTKSVEEARSASAVNLTTSLSNMNITSAIPMNVITSSGSTKKTNPVEMSHV